MSRVWEPTPKKASTLRPYGGEIAVLENQDFAYFIWRYELSPDAVVGNIKVSPALGRYVLPIFSPEGAVRGHVLRVPWPEAPRKPIASLPKADTFMSKHEPVQSFYVGWGGPGASRVLVAVEDQLSAIKLAEHGVDSVAMLGTPWSKDLGGYQGADRIAEIAQTAGDRELIVALDADATEDALEFARKWRYAFKRLRVAILTRDLKDTPMSEFGEVLGV